MTVTRRGLLGGGMLAGALAVPTVAGLGGWRWRQGAANPGDALLLYDPSLAAGRRFAEAGGSSARALQGDPVRLMQALLPARPALIAGISRHADAVLAIEAAGEAGYVLAAEMLGDTQQCSANTCDGGWVPLTRMAVGAGPAWVEALAGWAIDPQARELPAADARSVHRSDETALGWVLLPRG
ncbi:MAG: hypothetical protein V4647_08625 [Pseudomonadota bacterium]